MSTELSIVNERGQSMAELMGVTGTGGSTQQAGPTLSRIGMIHQPIMGEVDMGGKKLKTEVLPIGTYTVTKGEDVVYATEVRIRIFAMRQQWTRWNSETNEMEKTVLANSLNGDLQDNIGGYNLGRPSGYIEDWNALPDSTKQLIRSVKRTKVVFGTLTLLDPKDANGNDVSGDYTDIPFVYDIKNNTSIKNIDAAVKKINGLPIMADLILTSAEGSIPTGAKFGFVEAKVGDRREFEGGDEDLLRNFLEYIEYTNGKILDMHYERNKETLSAQDAQVVNDILNNDFVDVDE